MRARSFEFSCTTDPALDDDNDGVANWNDPDYLDNLDSDGDSVVDVFDVDSDNDGIPDVVEAGNQDANADGKVDSLNANGTLINDVDQDGWADNLGILSPEDTDGDGNLNYLDLDTDNDGVADIIESGGVDSNGDALIDALDTDMTLLNDAENDGWDNDLGITDPLDTDGDTIMNHMDLDSDNDGVSDAFESGVFDGDLNGLVDDFVNLNNNGWDSINGTTIPLNSDNDTIYNFMDLDSDNDGIADVEEAGAEDTDNDGVIDNFIDANQDGWDDNNPIIYLSDTDLDGLVDMISIDSDADGIHDVDEGFSGVNNALDANNDGMIDVLTDANFDGWDDGGVSTQNVIDTDDDGSFDYQDLDSDDDWLVDEIENDPSQDGQGPDDTDGDGTPDYRT